MRAAETRSRRFAGERAALTRRATGPSPGPYEGGTFHIDIMLPVAYPFEPVSAAERSSSVVSASSARAPLFLLYVSAHSRPQLVWRRRRSRCGAL